MTAVCRKSQNKETVSRGRDRGSRLLTELPERASGVRPERATPQSVQRPKGREVGFIKVAQTNAAFADNKGPELQSTLDVNVVAVTET